jgi:Family of unknown function (DUF6356)
MSLQRLFTEHPASVDETYGEHMVRASCFGGRMVVAGLACMVHALLPFIFVHSGSEAIDELHARMQATRRRAASSKPPVSPSQLASAGE